MIRHTHYQFVLPWPPSLNNYRSCINNRLITVSAGRRYFNDVFWIMRENNLHKEQIDQPVLINLVLCPPTRRTYDCSNFLKAYEDALVKAGFLKDDHWIEYGSIRKGDIIKKGQLLISVDLV